MEITQLGKLIPTFSLFLKKVLITIIVIFPLSLVVDTLIGSLIIGLPTLVIAMIYVMIISPFMVVLMPVVTKLLRLADSNL
jgi:antibiotic biosynthesis monooxygenase (ABM) superfamily enzyme